MVECHIASGYIPIGVIVILLALVDLPIGVRLKLSAVIMYRLGWVSYFHQWLRTDCGECHISISGYVPTGVKVIFPAVVMYRLWWGSYCQYWLICRLGCVPNCKQLVCNPCSLRISWFMFMDSEVLYFASALAWNPSGHSSSRLLETDSVQVPVRVSRIFKLSFF